MKADEIDRMLKQAAERDLPPDAALHTIERAQSALLNDLRPTPAMVPAGAFLLLYLLVFAVLAAAFAVALGLHGLPVLSVVQRALLFPALLLVAGMAAAGCARAMRPAGGVGLGGPALLLAATGLPVLFAMILENYSLLHFVAEGVPCLVAGMCVALPSGIVFAFLLRRGFVLDWSRAGLSAGTLAGLTGLAMLELHCPNLKAIHVIVWHVAVVVCGGALGFIAGWIADAVRRRGLRRSTEHA
jgi:hypothetical protein